MYSFVDYRITEIEFLNLKKHGVIPIKVPKTSLVYDAINGHPDIQLSIIDSKNKHILVHKDIDKSFLNILNEFNIKFSFSKNSLQNKYPYDIILNALISDNFFMHNLKFTDHLAFFGSLDKYLYGDLIKSFLSKHRVTPIYLSDYKLIDRGSILSI